MDKSAWSNLNRAPEEVQTAWQTAMAADQIATCAVVKLELLHSARNRDDFAEWEQDLSALRSVPVTESVCNAAVGAMRDLAEVRPLFHRVKPPDAIIAAAAQDRGYAVLHYDDHYDRLATVMEFNSYWLAPAGSI